MGNNDYDGDVAERSRATRTEVFTYQGYTGGNAEEARRPERRVCHPSLDIKGKRRECRETKEHPLVTPIVVAYDVTRSRGEDVRVVYGKLPMFIGQLIMKNYVVHPEVCWIAIGDATSGDQAPIQVGQFESDNRLDDQMSVIWLEEGGGGNGKESYEIAAYVGAYLMDLDANKRGEKGFFFFLGDEGLFLKVKRDQLKVWLGVDVSDDVPTVEVFRMLQEKFHVFFVYQKKAWDKKKADIDAEIKNRVEKAGGMYENVDIRCSLLWGNSNDLDLHCLTPAGVHIFYGSYCKSNGRGAAPCGGYLDVDMNVRGETTKPVENIRWEKGRAPKGRYQFWVENFNTHGGNAAATEFRAEVQIGQEIFHIEGKTPKGKTKGESQTMIKEFDFDPENLVEDAQDKYAAYDEEFIKSQWRTVLPADHILDLDDPKGVVDLMLGVIAIFGNNGIDLDTYIDHMDKREQSELRQKQIRGSLTGLAGSLIASDSGISQLALSVHKKKKDRKSTRL